MHGCDTRREQTGSTPISDDRQIAGLRPLKSDPATGQSCSFAPGQSGGDRELARFLDRPERASTDPNDRPDRAAPHKSADQRLD
jgi:hypothetical protein